MYKWCITFGSSEYPTVLKVFRGHQEAIDFSKKYPDDKLSVRPYPIKPL